MNDERYHEYMIRMNREADEIEMRKEGLGNHLIALKNKHHELDKRIEALIAERANEKFYISLKKEKLILKDKIVQIEKEIQELNK